MPINWDVAVLKSSDFLILDAEPGRFAIHAWKNITLSVWTARIEADAIERLSEASGRYSRLQLQPLSNIHLVQQDIGLPDGAARKRLIEISRHAMPHLATVGALVGGQGFWASRMRSLITGVRMMVPGPFELRLLGSIDEIVAWLPHAHERKTGVAIDPEELRMWIMRCDTRAPLTSRQPIGPVSGIEALSGNCDTLRPVFRPVESSIPPAASR